MKALLAIIGIGASLFCGMHALMLVGALAGGVGATRYGPTILLTHVAGAAFGLLIAVLCFRKCASKPASPADAEN
jgi:hypothetical protein